ncbi:MAG: hypothetical protein AAFU64_09340 [Bacteroidota bacterium]
MKKRVAKKILKNKENLKYHKAQLDKAETVIRKYEKNKPEEKPAEEKVVADTPTNEAQAEA